MHCFMYCVFLSYSKDDIHDIIRIIYPKLNMETFQ